MKIWHLASYYNNIRHYQTVLPEPAPLAETAERVIDSPSIKVDVRDFGPDRFISIMQLISEPEYDLYCAGIEITTRDILNPAPDRPTIQGLTERLRQVRKDILTLKHNSDFAEFAARQIRVLSKNLKLLQQTVADYAN